jgi:hypothetical protein
MSQIGKYCKAYPIARFREFPQWTENTANLRKRTGQADSAETEAEGELTDDSFLYLQQNYSVTAGIVIDENVVFDNVTPEWIDFCKETLRLEIPEYAQDDSDAGRAVPANGNMQAS